MKRLFTLMLCGLSGMQLIAGDAATNAPAAAVSPAPFRIEDGENALKKFKAELDAIQAVPVLPAAPEFKELRRARVAGCIRLYERVFNAHEKDFDFETHPAYMNIYVPGLPVSGMDPNQVSDPAVRAAYLAAIEDNKINIKHVNFEAGLKRLEMQITSNLSFYCKHFFKAEERTALDVLVMESTQDPAVQDKMRKLLGLEKSGGK